MEECQVIVIHNVRPAFGCRHRNNSGFEDNRQVSNATNAVASGAYGRSASHLGPQYETSLRLWIAEVEIALAVVGRDGPWCGLYAVDDMHSF